MLKSEQLSKILEVYVITYNRADILFESLSTICSQLPVNIKVTVVDNCSNDQTESKVKHLQNQYHSLFYTKNAVNIGLSANILRPFEYAKSKYVWILGDDDLYNFEGISDLINILEFENYKLIHAGAHACDWKINNICGTPRQLISQNYPYFMYSSFIGCNIIERDAFIEYGLIQGYDNIVNGYPHMPFIHNLFLRNEDIYVTKIKHITALVGNQSYDEIQWLRWWIGNSMTIENNELARKVFLNHFNDEMDRNVIDLLSIAAKNPISKKITKHFVRDILTNIETLHFYWRNSGVRFFLVIIKSKLTKIFIF